MAKNTVKSFLFLYLAGGMFLLLILYMSCEYVVFKKKYEDQILKEAQQFENSLSHILDTYKEALEKIAHEITEKDIFTDTEAIINCLKRASAYGIENITNDNIRISGINWINRDNPFPIGQIGPMKSKFAFPQEYLNNLENNPSNFEILGEWLPNNSSLPYVINMGVGVYDSKKNYRGFLNARINLEALAEKLKRSYFDNTHEFILLDKNSQIVASSITLTPNKAKEITETSQVGRINENLFNPETGMFTSSFVLQANKLFCHLHIICFNKDFYSLFISSIAFQTILLFVFSFSLVIFSMLYHKRLVKRAVNISKEKNKENCELLKQNRRLESYVKSSDEAEKEGRKFQLEVNYRISRALSDIIYVGNCLFNRINENEQIEENSSELLDVFAKAYSHSRFSCVKSEERPINAHKILEDACTILSKKILKKNILIKKDIKEKIKEIVNDELSIKQVFINVLNRAIQNSPKKGIIEINLFTDKESLFLECRDNGYVPEDQIKNENLQEDKVESTDCMSLQWQDLEKLVSLLGGKISSHYEPYKGNDLILKLPYQISEDLQIREHLKIKQGNNVIPFSNLKKERLS